MDVDRRGKIFLWHGLMICIPAAYIILATGCPIRFLTTVPCPFCGMSRAIYSFFTGDFAKAFTLHPLFWFGPLLLFVGVHKDTRLLAWLPKPFLDWFCIAGAVLIFLVYLARMFFGDIP